MHWNDVVTLLSALAAAVAAFLGAYKSHQAASRAGAAGALQAHVNRKLETLLSAPAAAAPVPGTSINDVLRYWDLLTKIRANWQMVKSLPAHQAGTLDLIKARVDGRHVRLGPTPVEFDD